MTLTTRYPCCGGVARIVAVDSVPRERYDRKCSRCGRVWEIERRTLRENEDGGRIDRLDWVPVVCAYARGSVQSEVSTSIPEEG